VFTYYFPVRSFRQVPMFSGITPMQITVSWYACLAANPNKFDFNNNVSMLCSSCRIKMSKFYFKEQKQVSFQSSSRCPLSPPCYTVTDSYRSLYMNQVPGDCYLHRCNTTKHVSSLI
jgi:hypothetical protein